MKIVVTGALGHIGSALLREFPGSFPGAEIVLLDNLSSQRYCALFNLPREGRYRFCEMDIVEDDLCACFEGARVVVHLAASTNAAGSFQKKEEVERVNCAGTERVARACLKAGCPLIFPSTTSVYGSQSAIVDESCPAHELKPQSPYAASKLAAEQRLHELGGEGLRFVICRLGTIFGTSPGMRFHTAINKFCWQAVLGQPVTVWRTALHQYRPYLELGDCLAAFRFILQREMFDQQVYNLVSHNATVSQIIEIISARIPELSIQFVDSAIMNQLSYQVSNDRFERLGFEFRGTMERGISQTLELLNGLAARGWIDQPREERP